MDKPRIFLGSSGKQEKLLQALTRGLEDVAHVEPWTTSFNPGTTTLERLLELAHQVDFAAFAFARDDWTTNSDFTTRSDTHPKINARTSGVHLRADPEDMSRLDGSDDRQRAELIAERLRHWKSITNA